MLYSGGRYPKNFRFVVGIHNAGAMFDDYVKHGRIHRPGEGRMEGKKVGPMKSENEVTAVHRITQTGSLITRCG